VRWIPNSLSTRCKEAVAENFIFSSLFVTMVFHQSHSSSRSPVLPRKEGLHLDFSTTGTGMLNVDVKTKSVAMWRESQRGKLHCLCKHSLS
jgi:hypothetical protein